MSRARRALTVGIAALALLLPGLVVPPSAAATSGTASITVTPSQIVVGDSVTAAGIVESTDPSCASGRAIELQAARADQMTWSPVAQGTTAADGSYSFSQAPQLNGFYRVVLPLTTVGSVTCDAIASGRDGVHVVAKVNDTLSATSVAAGDCVQMTVTVQPAKPGQTVNVEQQDSNGWKVLATPTLDPTSSAVADVCPGWSSIGTVQLRAEWNADTLNLAAVGPALSLGVVLAPWMAHLEGLIGDRAVSVSVGESGAFLYEHAGAVDRVPASNEKLPLSMALLDELGPTFRIVTHVAARAVHHGVVEGDLWILGRGDPSITTSKLRALAKEIADAGVHRITGSVMGSTGYFSHDWFASGWKKDFPREEIPLPSALTFNGNQVSGVHVSDPEQLAAEALTTQLESRGVRVDGNPGEGRSPDGLTDVATISSPPLSALLRRQNVDSLNFFAEVLGKLLGVRASGVPGTIAKGAAAIAAWTSSHGVTITARDGSGLSYDDRITAEGMVRLLGVADGASWGTALRDSLPVPGRGTLEGRLVGVQVRAKTGTLTNISALSGWVWLTDTKTWAAFSILSRGLPKDRAISLEDAIVRTLSQAAH